MGLQYFNVASDALDGDHLLALLTLHYKWSFIHQTDYGEFHLVHENMI